ncbi:MAG: AIR synthase-related protein, partial [Candidatus Muiribacteriaceae bacterium]
SVQAGDPFTEKMLLEACLELYQYDYIVGIQDMGAAGITCSTFEMSERGGCGMDVELDRVPQREPDMTPYEIMLSESQERMLMVVKPGCEKKVENIFRKWDLHVEKIGHVIEENRVIVREHGEIVADLPVDFVVNGFPVYDREYREPDYYKNIKTDTAELPEKEVGESLRTLLQSPNLVSRKEVFRQYDHQVQLNTMVGPGRGDAAVLRLKGTEKALAFTVDCNSRRCYIDPEIGSRQAVFEASRNLVCSGARPVAVTDGLNFGNPKDPGVYWQFVKSVDGIIAGCNALNTPVTGGNVSFYNQSGKKAVYPTPVIGMLGIIEDRRNAKDMAFRKGHVIGMLGESHPEIGGSEYAAFVHGKVCGPLYDFDMEIEIRINDLILEHIALFSSLHDVSDGGLALALFESAFCGGVGIEVDCDIPFRKDMFFFSESFGRVIFSAAEEDFRKITESCIDRNIAVRRLGMVCGDTYSIKDICDIPMSDLTEIYMRGL